MDYRVEDFGAIGNGIADDTKAINDGIRFCSKNLCNLIFSENKCYRSGKINLLDNTTLIFEKNSILKATDNLDLFKDENSFIKLINEPTYDNCDYDGKPNMFFLYAKDKKNIKILGDGIIDGNEEIFYGKIEKYHIDGYFYPRVPLIFMENVNSIDINGITLRKSGFWTLHLVGCNNCFIKDIKILNNMILANCDGIDIDHSKNVTIDNCFIKGADDSIVIKTTEAFEKYGNSENIIIKNSNLSSTSAAIKFGTETTGIIQNVYAVDCKIFNSNRGISLQLRDEGCINNIKFENIDIDTHRVSDEDWWGKAEGISITALKRYENKKIGSIYNIEFQNIKINGEHGIFIYGEDNINIFDVKFNDIKIYLNKKNNYDLLLYDLRPTYKNKLFKDDLAYIYAKNAKNIFYNNLIYNSDDEIKKLIKEKIIEKNVL